MCIVDKSIEDLYMIHLQRTGEEENEIDGFLRVRDDILVFEMT